MPAPPCNSNRFKRPTKPQPRPNRCTKPKLVRRPSAASTISNASTANAIASTAQNATQNLHRPAAGPPPSPWLLLLLWFFSSSPPLRARNARRSASCRRRLALRSKRRCRPVSTVRVTMSCRRGRRRGVSVRMCSGETGRKRRRTTVKDRKRP